MKFEGKTFEEIKNNVQDYLENPSMIALPGGSWCFLCGVELCRNGKHMSRQMLLLVMNKLIRDLEEARK